MVFKLHTMCENCNDFLGLLLSFDDKLSLKLTERPCLTKLHLEIVFQYIHAFSQRQCLCVFRDTKNLERFFYLTQGILYLSVLQLKELVDGLAEMADGGSKPSSTADASNQTDDNDAHVVRRISCDKWSLQDKEKLFSFLSKLFLMNFPLYQASKSCHSKADEIPPLEMVHVHAFCDINDMDVPMYLVRNVAMFGRLGGIQLVTACFDDQTPESLPVTMAHALIGVACNLKLWFNARTINTLFVPLRSKILRYMCILQDKDFRMSGIKHMAEYMWNAVKEPFDSPATFDRDGLELAFKYFTSSTLTMRLAGIAQINSYIGVFNELCNNENMAEAESVGQSLADWLISVNIISHIFGPNLHVEVIKQSHVILNFLAMECKISNDHIDIIWQAAQLKHCSKQVHDLLPPFISNLESGPVLHLYNLLCNLEPKEHSEQTLFLASALIKCMWTNGGSYHLGGELSLINMKKVSLGNMKLIHQHEITSSDNSISNSEVESSQHSEPQKTPSEASEGPTPCKRPRKHRHIHRHKHIPHPAQSSDESIKIDDCDEIEDDDDDEDEEDEDEDEEDDEDEDEDDGIVEEHAVEHRRSMKLLKRSMLNSHFMLHEGQCVAPVETLPSVQPKKDEMKARLPIPAEKELVTDKPIEQEGEAPKELMKQLLKDCSPPKPATPCKTSPAGNEENEASVVKQEETEPAKTSEGQSELKVQLESDHDADEEKSGNEDNGLKVKKKKILKKRKHSGVNSSSSEKESEKGAVAGTKTGSDDDDEDEDETESENETKKKSPDKPVVKAVEGEEDMSVDEAGSYSSRMSTKSEKNMADFEGDDSACEEEMVRLSEHRAQMTNLAFHSRFHGGKLICRGEHCRTIPCRATIGRIPARFPPDNVCKPGNTLLWDLLQDDKIEQLGENLTAEAEKVLSNLLCYNLDKQIRIRFIEGCLENLSRNWSVVVSLRLLAKLLSSFQEFRATNTHTITTWAEKNLHMMKHFFNNLQVYSLEGPKFYPHQVEVNVRLQFLSSVFSPIGSPDSFRLSLAQVDTLWSCLATDPQCSDDLFRWLLNNSRSKDHQHALGLDALRHLFLKKLPTLPPETMSIVGLTLFQQLHSVARFTAGGGDVREIDRVGMEYLWKVALRANNTDISMTAIAYINQYYMNRQLENENEFIAECMSYLASASRELAASEESSLLCIQRALLLLKTHLETFKRRYAYHLRRWTLEGKSVGSHVPLLSGDRGCMPLRVYVQPANNVEKGVLDLLSTDYVADLRAEVAKWWESLQLRKGREGNQETPVLGALLTDGPIRMITTGQELTTEYDEKTLHEMMFKDQQLVYISMGASRPQKRREVGDTPSILPPPPRENLPTLLLLQPPYFEQLFQLMQSLSAMKTTVKGGHHIPHTKAQVLSRRVWEILTILPTNPTLLEGFQRIESSDLSLQELLDPSSPQKLMYSLHIIESLLRPVNKFNAGDASKALNYEVSWCEIFIRQGGLRNLFDIFMSGALQQRDGSEWQQDCLASLLKLLCHLCMVPRDPEPVSETAEAGSMTRFKQRRKKTNNLEKPVPKLSNEMLNMLNVDGAMERLTSILYEASLPRDPNHYKTGFWGRAQVVHYAMALLVSWVHSAEGVRDLLFTSPNFSTWLQRLVLEDPEPAVRREVCTALYRLCLGAASDPPPMALAAPMLAKLLEFLDIAEAMGPQKYESLHNAVEDGKEPYGPACRDYFWVLCRLVENLPEDLIKESIEEPATCIVDINGLALRLATSIVNRDYLESRHNTVEDNALVGLLNLMTHVVKHFPPFKTSKEGHGFLIQLFEFLFALPNPRMRFLPKCKSQLVRSSTYDLIVEMVKGAPDNHLVLHRFLMSQHQQGPHYPYPWDYWPHEDGRSDCGYVGLTNLGATCYMASCMQHLYMMPQARTSILDAKCTPSSKHEETLKELQRMFAYLMESERKAYNPRSFCKVYTMDHQPLNTGEQKDMAEFFIDLVSKLEEMTPETKTLVKTLFGGVLSNNVVSLDCGHVSRTLEEFYTVRCQVTDMRNLYESLDEVTVKDTLEGDNMYTCSQCGKKVRAEKRACFKKLPHILCFNTMRYTFNMLTMLKEKVNTLFSFPLRLDMSGYVEKNLMPQHYEEEKRKSQMRENGDHSEDPNDTDDFNEKYEYELIGVTVHTGTADGGHYYSFIRDRTSPHRDKWFLFNDAEVKPFDPNQLATECFGGEMTSKTYDSVNDKFMDFSFEKTNSAYMLFYEWCSPSGEQRNSKEESPECKDAESSHSDVTESKTADGEEGVHRDLRDVPECKTVVLPQFELCKDLEDWIWQDNMHFLRDKNIFEHTYFNFMWQICSQVPQTLASLSSNTTELAAQLSTSFFLETYIHAKEKPMMVQWMELLTKQFVASRAACEWFLGHMAQNDWWPMQILIKCPNQMVRQMFQRLCIHVIQQLRQSHVSLYLKSDSDDEGVDESDPEKIGTHSCVTLFVRKLISLMEHNSTKTHLKHLTEYFMFLYEFSKMGETEAQFLISIQVISTMVNFYLGQKASEFVEIVSEEEEEEEVVPVTNEKYKPVSLDKMITLIATLVEKSRGPDNRLELSEADMTAVAGGKWFPFIYQQTRDAINLNQTRNLIFALSQNNDRLAQLIIHMIFQTVARFSDGGKLNGADAPYNIQHSFQAGQPFLKLLSLLTDPTSFPAIYANSPGMPCFSQYILQGIWEVAEVCPAQLIDWLSLQVTRNPHAHAWVMQSLEKWVENYLLANSNQRVRTAAAFLVVSLVPNTQFRQWYRSARGLVPQRELILNSEATNVLHTLYSFLLQKLKVASKYSDVQEHGPSKLTAYFTLMHYCCVSRTEKLMFTPYFMDLWNLFLPNLSEPSVSVHYNKQALLSFWYHVSTDCPENLNLILSNPQVTKNIAFNYILADHEDQEVVMFNRAMLPVYYGLLRLCCHNSRQFTRHLAGHQNINWAFKNITPYASQYPAAVEELFKLMQIFATKYPDMSDQEVLEVNNFRKATIQLYLQTLDGRIAWSTLLSAYRILVESEEEKLHVIQYNGVQTLFEAFQTLHSVYHEGSTCQIVAEILELLNMLLMITRTLGTLPTGIVQKDARVVLLSSKDWMDVVRKLATLQNSYNPPEMRTMALDLLKEMLIVMPREVTQLLTPLLSHCHAAFQESTTAALPMGPYFPRKGAKTPTFGLKPQRPGRPMVQMAVPNTQIEPKGQNEEYDSELMSYFVPYHNFIDTMCRLAINHNCMSDSLIQLSALVGFEGVPLHLTFFPKLWLEIHDNVHLDKKLLSVLVSNNFFIEYVETILLDERMSLNVPVIYKFLSTFFPKVASRVLSDNTCQLIENLVVTFNEKAQQMDTISKAAPLNADLRALYLVYSNVDVPIAPPDALVTTLVCLQGKVRAARPDATPEDVSSSNSSQDLSKETDAEKPTASTSSDKIQNERSPSPIDWLAELDATISQLLAIINKPI